MIRLDDLTAGSGWSFDDPVASGRADDVGAVLSAIREAEDRTTLGEWVVLVVAYEAAPAFDPALRTAPRPPSGTPYVWWQSFAERGDAAPLDFAESRVITRHRRPNTCPYQTAVERVRSRIRSGEVYQVNVTDRFDGTFTGTPSEMYEALVGVQTCEFAAYIEMDEQVIVSASPELFFRWDETTITCRPMKGTAPRLARPAEDVAAAAALRDSAKENAENVMIVDLLRNDLGRIADIGSVQVPHLLDLERYETVWQLTSTVTAQVAVTTELVDVLASLFPCGSVTGAPKVAAMEVITELEAEPRGVYCGAIGMLSPVGQQPRAVFSVPIRTAVADPGAGTFEYGAGAGITWSSDPAAEDAEVRAKARILTRSHRRLDLLETMRVDADGLRHVARHLDRMQDSAAWFGFPFDRDEIERLLDDIDPSPRTARVRVLMSPTGVFSVERHELTEAPSPVRLAVDDATTRSDDPYCCHKTTFRRHYDEARRRHAAADDVVLVNEHGAAIETTIANLAYRIGAAWYCPPLTDGGLAGVGRQVAIDAGLLTERSIPAVDLASCDELAVVNDLRGWRPAVLTSSRE